MMTYRVGACASPSAGKAMAEYYLAGTLKMEQTRAAEYYTGAEAREERAANFWRGAIREGHLAADGTVAELRPDLSPALAARLGIANPDRPLTQAGIANLLNATRIDGSAIVGRKKHTATRSVAEVFGLDPKQPASAESIRNVLAGKRADGGMPQTAAAKALPAEIVEGARKRFKAALGVPAHREGALCCRAGHSGMDQLSALHRTAGRRYRAAGQARPGLHRYPRGAVADGGPAASHPCDGVQQCPDRQQAYRRRRPRPAGRAGERAGCGLPCLHRGPGPASRHRDRARRAHRRRAPRRSPAFGARIVQQADDRSAGCGARFRGTQGHRLGCHHRRAEDCLVEGWGGRNPAGKKRDGGRRGTEKRFRGVARASRGGLLPPSQRAAAGRGYPRPGG